MNLTKNKRTLLFVQPMEATSFLKPIDLFYILDIFIEF